MIEVALGEGERLEDEWSATLIGRVPEPLDVEEDVDEALKPDPALEEAKPGLSVRNNELRPITRIVVGWSRGESCCRSANRDQNGKQVKFCNRIHHHRFGCLLGRQLEVEFHCSPPL